MHSASSGYQRKINWEELENVGIGKGYHFLEFLAKPPKKAGLQPVKLRTEVSNVDLISADRVWVAPPPQ